MQTQQPIWKFLQKHHVVNFVVKTSVAAVVGLITVSSASVSLSGEGNLAYSATNCLADEHAYTIAYGDSHSPLTTRFNLAQDLLSSHNKQIRSQELQANNKMCVLPNRKQDIIATKMIGVAHSMIAMSSRKKVATFHFRARAIPSVRISTQVPATARDTPLATTATILQTVPIRNAPLTAPTNAIRYSNPFPYPACTWWADQRYYQMHGIFVPWSNGANAWQWSARAADYGWRVSGSPMVGSIMVLQPYVEGAGGYGHVAYVEQVLDNSRVIASSMNWGANPYAVTRGIFFSGAGVTFIHL